MILCSYCNARPIKRKGGVTCGDPECRNKHIKSPEYKRGRIEYMKKFRARPGFKERERAYAKVYVRLPKVRARRRKYELERYHKRKAAGLITEREREQCRARTARYYRRHNEKIKARRAEWRAANRERINRQARERLKKRFDNFFIEKEREPARQKLIKIQKIQYYEKKRFLKQRF